MLVCYTHNIFHVCVHTDILAGYGQYPATKEEPFQSAIMYMYMYIHMHNVSTMYMIHVGYSSTCMHIVILNDTHHVDLTDGLNDDVHQNLFWEEDAL